MFEQDERGVPTDFKALLLEQPMRRTKEGARVAIGSAPYVPSRQLSILRRFTGETLLEYLISASESVEAVQADAYSLFKQGLIEPNRQLRARGGSIQPQQTLQVTALRKLPTY